MSFPGGSVVKNSPANAEKVGSVPGSGRFPGKELKPAPVFLRRKAHGQTSPAGYGLWGHKRARHNLVTKQQQ